MHTLDPPPPGMPEDDDGTQDGGGPPKRRETFPEVIARILARHAALHEARICAADWADQSGSEKYVIAQGEYFFLADAASLIWSHKAEIAAGRARIAWTAVPITPATLPPDVAFAPAGWD